MDARVGFKPTIVEICSHLPWVTRPPRDYDTLTNVGIKTYYNIICFNTLEFFIPQEEIHHLVRPFAHVLSAG